MKIKYVSTVHLFFWLKNKTKKDTTTVLGLTVFQQYKTERKRSSVNSLLQSFWPRGGSYMVLLLHLVLSALLKEGRPPLLQSTYCPRG